MKGLQHWSVSVDADNLCWLTLDVVGKSVNVLTHAVMAELGQILDWLDQQDTSLALACCLASRADLFTVPISPNLNYLPPLMCVTAYADGAWVV